MSSNKKDKKQNNQAKSPVAADKQQQQQAKAEEKITKQTETDAQAPATSTATTATTTTATTSTATATTPTTSATSSTETAPAAKSNEKEELFPPMNPDDDVDRIQTIESLCLSCNENGTTHLLLTKIPYYRDVILMAFECPHCGFKSSEMQSAGAVGVKALTFTLSVNVEKKFNEALNMDVIENAGDVHTDLNRQVVKSDAAEIRIPELQFEIPRNGKGEVTTVEGIVSTAAENLQMTQEARREANGDEIADKVQAVIDKLRLYADGKESFTFVLHDISGNSFLENPYVPEKDPRVKMLARNRTGEEHESLGFLPEQTKEPFFWRLIDQARQRSTHAR